MPIPFTQFLRPTARRKRVEIEAGPEIEEKAEAILAAGYRFECEVLTTGHVSLTIADPRIGDDVAIEVVPNGPAVPEAVNRLVTKFDPSKQFNQEEAHDHE